MIVTSRGQSWTARAVRIAILGIACGFGVVQIIFALRDWSLVDMEAYWSAALRIREGAPLYPVLPDSTTADVYRYAPWFAAAWIPLTFLPKAVVGAAWSALLIAATAYVLRAIVRLPSPPAIAAAGLVGGLLVLIDSTGNVQALLVAMLLFGVERRSGPLWIALAASLKAVPLLFVLVYAGRGEWGRVLLTLALTALLLAPALLFDLEGYPTDPGELSYSLFNRSFALWAVVVAGCVALALAAAVRGSRHAWLAASLGAIAALPRLWTYDFTFLAVGLARARGDGR